MKKIYFAVLIILFSFFINLVKAENNVFINEISIEEKSDGVIESKEPVINGLKVDFDLKFEKVGAFIKYKLLINNRDSEDFTLNSNYKGDNDYIKYEYFYENDNKVLVAGGEKIVYVLITYDKQVPSNLFNEGVYRENRSTSLSFYNNRLPEEQIDNPKTSTASILLIIMAVALSFIISFLLSSRKMRRYLGIIVICVSVLLPFMIYAINSLAITINTKIEIVKNNKYCVYSVSDFSYREYDYEDNETWNSSFNKNQEFLSNKFSSKESIDCFKEYYDNNYSKDEEDLEKLAVCEQKYDNSIIVVDGEDIIKGIEEGCYESAALK